MMATRRPICHDPFRQTISRRYLPSNFSSSFFSLDHYWNKNKMCPTIMLHMKIIRHTPNVYTDRERILKLIFDRNWGEACSKTFLPTRILLLVCCFRFVYIRRRYARLRLIVDLELSLSCRQDWEDFDKTKTRSGRNRIDRFRRWLRWEKEMGILSISKIFILSLYFSIWERLCTRLSRRSSYVWVSRSSASYT